MRVIASSLLDGLRSRRPANVEKRIWPFIYNRRFSEYAGSSNNERQVRFAKWSWIGDCLCA